MAMRTLAAFRDGWVGMTGEPRTNETTVNRQQFLWMARGLSGFKGLDAEIGDTNTESVANLMFDSQVRETNPDGRYLRITATERPSYLARIDRLLQIERSQIREKRSYAAKLLEVATAGKLRDALAQMTEPEANYSQPRKRPQKATPECEVLKACDWIAHSIHGDARPAILDALTRHILTAPVGTALGQTPQLLDQIHAEVVADAPRVRSPNSATAYPSSVGGRFLLELIFQWTSEAIWPAPGDDQWQDVALFYLGAVATVQGYADGNKRAGRLAYAITLLKGGQPFVAPSAALESELVRMNRTDPA